MFVFKKPTVKEMKSAPSDDELVLMFLNKKRRKRRFWVCPILKRRQQRGKISLFGPGVDTVSWPLLYFELLFKSSRVSEVKLNYFIISIFNRSVYPDLIICKKRAWFERINVANLSCELHSWCDRLH